ncbi:MAG: hypothetical protein ACLUOI_01445 [Eisenbergiella sp.]
MDRIWMVDLAGPADLRVDVDSLPSGMGIGFPPSGRAAFRKRTFMRRIVRKAG